jgi:hypothetical protein
MKFQKYIENKLVGKIQIQYRHRMSLAPDKKISDMVRVRNIFRLRSSVLRAHFYDMAKEVVGEFIDSLIMPYKTKYMCLQFILRIKNMQRRWVKHLEKKREVLENFESMWGKFLIRLADREEDYKKMGITYNLDNVKFISREVRGKIGAHLFDRQILRYIDAKYETLEWNYDKKIGEKAKILMMEDKDDRESSKPGEEAEQKRPGQYLDI